MAFVCTFACSFQRNDAYGKKYPTGEEPYNRVKSTIPSTHVNMYQLDKPTRREPKVVIWCDENLLW